MWVNSVQIARSDFAVTSNQCAGRNLAPGTSCTFKIQPQPTNTGLRGAEALVDTSEGPYRFPLRVEGLAGKAPPAPPAPPLTLNFEGPWWNPRPRNPVGASTLAHQDDVIFTTWFTYDAKRQGDVAVDERVPHGPTTYSGTLYRTTGPSLHDRFRSTRTQVQRAEVGSATLSFTDAATARSPIR